MLGTNLWGHKLGYGSNLWYGVGGGGDSRPSESSIVKPCSGLFLL